ncbi:hypothetical protein F5Y08DRAFT_252300 [Xylaria arbuscula]|nr:hypothetical protein F5Y08DRAFT_252300 [Xylaria arbuscula]
MTTLNKNGKEEEYPKPKYITGGCLCEALRYRIDFPEDHDFEKSVRWFPSLLTYLIYLPTSIIPHLTSSHLLHLTHFLVYTVHPPTQLSGLLSKPINTLKPGLIRGIPVPVYAIIHLPIPVPTYLSTHPRTYSANPRTPIVVAVMDMPMHPMPSPNRLLLPADAPRVALRIPMDHQHDHGLAIMSV